MNFSWIGFPVESGNCLQLAIPSRKRVFVLQEVEKQKSNTKLAEQQLVNQQQVLQQEKVGIPVFITFSLGRRRCADMQINTPSVQIYVPQLQWKLRWYSLGATYPHRLKSQYRSLQCSCRVWSDSPNIHY